MLWSSWGWLQPEKKSENYYVHRKLSIWTVLTIFIKSGLHWRYNIQHYLSEERAWFIIILVQIKKNKKSENILWKFKPSKAKLLQLKLIQIIARAILLRKKLEIKKLSPFYYISGLSLFDFQLSHKKKCSSK